MGKLVKRTVTLEVDKHPQYSLIVVDIYYFFGGAFKLAELLEQQTKVKWMSRGCFIDNCCFETKEEVPDSFEFTYTWDEPK